MRDFDANTKSQAYHREAVTPSTPVQSVARCDGSLLGEIIGRKEVEHSLGLSNCRSARIVQPQSGDCRSADGGSTDEWAFVLREILGPLPL